jgi:hypothetical protein
VNGGAWQQTATTTLGAGGSLTLGPHPFTGGSWSWTGSGGFTATTREIVRSNIQSAQGGNYVATHTNACGATSTQTYTIAVTTGGTGCTQASEFGHYTAEISNATANPTIKFIPATTGMGSPTCILYYSTSSTGTYPGYIVTPNTAFQITASAGTTIYYYYTYSLATGGEQNTAAYKRSFVVGNCGAGGASARMSTAVDVAYTPEEEEGSDEVVIYPNPVKDELYFTVEKSLEGGSLKIVDSVGKERVIEPKDGERKIDVSSFTPGLYILRISKRQRSAVRRFVKE